MEAVRGATVGVLGVETALDQVTCGQTRSHDLAEGNTLLRSDVRHALTVRFRVVSDVEQTSEAS